MTDYASAYNGNWGRADRFGESSFEDPAPIIQQILSLAGPGRVLDIGCGMGVIVRQLLATGLDAYGLDVSAVAIGSAHRFAPGRFMTGSLLALPFPDNSFDTLVSTDCLEYLAPEDIARAFREMYRVSRRTVFLRVATGPDRDGLWHLTVHGRNWWEGVAFETGFRKHPAYYRINDFAALEHDGYTIAIPLEKVPEQARGQYPIEALRVERDLHMDMLRETGRRSDAHVHRYAIAANLVRPGDRVLDAACGLGYGTHLLACLSVAGSLLGMDLSEGAITYASACYGSGDSRITFRAGDVQDLSALSDHSLDLVVSFETLEHIPCPERFLQEAARVLKPGGRIIVSVPHRWADASGRDPNPWHLHVYDWEKLSTQLRAHFLVERAYGETAGAGMRLAQHPRDFFAFDPQAGPGRDCEWLLAVGMCDPRAGRGLVYVEQMYAPEECPEHLIAFSRDYLNAYLPHAMVSIPWRLADARLLRDLAQDVLATYPASSADHAGAVCVLAYQYLANPQADAQAGWELLAQLTAIDRGQPVSPHYLRWQISGAYVAGLISLRLGDHEAALAWFRRCAAFDCRAFSPTLGTKTISAAWQAGRLLAQIGDTRAAKIVLHRGIEVFFGLFRDGRESLLGKADRPFDFPYYELAEIAAAVTSCVNLLRQIDQAPGAPLPTLAVQNLQTVITSLRADLCRCQAQLREADRHWSIRVLRKTYRFLKKIPLIP